jgi:hypothetical protein
VPSGADGWRIMSIEHLAPRSDEPDLADVYTNTVLTCSRCNSTRGSRATEAGGESISPTTQPWAIHFVSSADTLEPLTPQGEAIAGLYGVNDRLRRLARRVRRENLVRLHSLLERVSELRQQEEVTPGIRADLEALRAQLGRAFAAYQLVPRDAPLACGCRIDPLEVPQYLTEQAELLDVEWLPDAP